MRSSRAQFDEYSMAEYVKPNGATCIATDVSHHLYGCVCVCVCVCVSVGAPVCATCTAVCVCIDERARA